MAAFRSETKIAILDDHAVVRIGVVAQLQKEAGFFIVGNYETSRAMLAGLRTAPADVLVIDFALGPAELDGVSLIRFFKSKFPDSRVLIFSSHYDPATVALALRVGAQGFVGKNQGMADVVKAIRCVASGGIYLSDDMSYRLAESSTAAHAELPAELTADEKLIVGANLSAKEREVIRCFLQGMTVSQIAEKFSRSAKTISTQKSMAFRKLGISADHELFKIKRSLEDL